MARSQKLGRPGVAADARALVYLYSRLPFLVQRVDQVATALFAIEAGALQITPLQFQLLDQLKFCGPASQVELARRCGIDTSTASLVLGNLIKAKLARRTTDATDKRRKIVDLTATGSSVHVEAAAAYKRVQRRLFLALGDGKDEFVDALQRIVGSGAGAPPWQPQAFGNPRPKGCSAPVAESPTFLIRRTLQQAEANMAAELGAYDLTIRQYATLFVICFHDGIGESGLGRMLGYEASNAALVVKLLGQKGLITADAIHARGRRRYRATTAGKALLLALEPALTRGEAVLAGELAPDEIPFVQRMLGRMIDALDNVTRSPLAYFSIISESPQWPVPLQPHLTVELSIT